MRPLLQPGPQPVASTSASCAPRGPRAPLNGQGASLRPCGCPGSARGGQPGGRPRAAAGRGNLTIAAATPPGPKSYESGYEHVVDRRNVDPDLTDPDWTDKVTDWQEFWYPDEAWGEEGLLDDLDDEEDAATRSAASVERAQLLIEQLKDLPKRRGVANILKPAPMVEGLKNLADWTPGGIRPYDNPPAEPWEVRAIMEKRRQRQAMDREWRTQQSLVNRHIAYSQEHDVRLEDWPTDDHWTHDMIIDLVHGYGEYVRIEKIRWVELNPLINVDYPQDYGVEEAPDVEDFIAMTGHMRGDDDDYDAEGIELDLADFGQGPDVFEDSGGHQYTTEPPNAWRQLQELRVASMLDEDGYVEEEDSDDEEGGDGAAAGKAPRKAAPKRGRPKTAKAAPDQGLVEEDPSLEGE